MAHQIAAERRGQQVADAGGEGEVALAHPGRLRREQLARQRSGDDDGVGQGQGDLRQHRVDHPVLDLGQVRPDQVRQVQAEIERGDRRREAGQDPDGRARDHRDQGDGHARDAHQGQHQGAHEKAQPDLVLDIADAEPGQRQAEPQLQAGGHRRRQGAGDAADQPRGAGDQEEGPDDEAGAGNGAGAHRLDQDRRRRGLHRLHGHGDAVEGAGRGVEQAEGDEDAGRIHPHHGDRANDVRQEGAEVAQRA